MELEPLTIYYLDFGNVENVQIEDLYPLPKRLQTIPPVVRCTSNIIFPVLCLSRSLFIRVFSDNLPLDFVWLLE